MAKIFKWTWRITHSEVFAGDDLVLIRAKPYNNKSNEFKKRWNINKGKYLLLSSGCHLVYCIHIITTVSVWLIIFLKLLALAHKPAHIWRHQPSAGVPAHGSGSVTHRERRSRPLAGRTAVTGSSSSALSKSWARCRSRCWLAFRSWRRSWAWPSRTCPSCRTGWRAAGRIYLGMTSDGEGRGQQRRRQRVAPPRRPLTGPGGAADGPGWARVHL